MSVFILIFPSNCSGAMYILVPLSPTLASVSSFAKPKSIIFSVFSSLSINITFSGFRSQCTIPLVSSTFSPFKIYFAISFKCSVSREKALNRSSKIHYLRDLPNICSITITALNYCSSLSGFSLF